MSREMKAERTAPHGGNRVGRGTAGFRRSAPQCVARNRVDARRRARSIEHRHLIDEVKAREFWRAIERSRANSSRDKPLPTSGMSWLVLRMKPTRASTPIARLLVPQRSTVSQLEERLGVGKSS
jgi:hypothetical protein